MSRIIDFLRARWPWLVGAALIGALAWLLSHGITVQGQVTRRAEAFRQALEAQEVDEVLEMISEDYEDPWGLSREELGLALRDVTTQFLVMNVEFSGGDISRHGELIVFSTPIKVRGRPITPAGNYIESHSVAIREPFHLMWRKEGLWPWAWKLQRIEHETLELPGGYRPGMFSERSLLERAAEGAGGG